ncbi:MAG: menaquinone biosynthesis decarboxylase [Acidobacteriota bacterium]
MAYRDLRELLARFEREGECRRITAPVSANLEITEITDRVVKAGGPALLFTNVTGSSMPVLINLFGTERRMAAALSVDRLEEVAARVEAMLSEKPPESFLDKLRKLPRLMELSAMFPKIVGDGPCREIVRTEGFSVKEIPALRCWPGDGGPFITFPAVFTKDPETGERNVGVYRMQVYDDRTTAMHWHLHKHGAGHYRKAVKLGKRLPVSVALSCEPEVMYAATAPLPDGVDEMMLAGFLRGEPVRLVRCVTNDLEVPASAEIVLEGYVDPGDLRREGPFGDHTGYYSLDDDYPVFHVTAITQRKDPIYQTIVVGVPPQEDCYLGLATEKIFLPLMRKQLPEVVDFHMPFEGVFHNLVVVSIRKSYPGHARKIMHALWGMGQAMFSKCIVVLDDDVDVRDYRRVLFTALNHIDPERDVEMVMGPVETLDHASRLPWYGSKMGVDATRKWKEEGFQRRWPDLITMSPEVRARVDAMWRELGLAES